MGDDEMDLDEGWEEDVRPGRVNRHGVLMVEVDPEDWVDCHNAKRRMHGVPYVSWSEEVALSATKWARFGQCTHSPEDCEFGESLYRSSHRPSAQRVVDAWYSEIEHYDFDNPAPCPAAGHFTQLVWKDSVEIGCAMCRMDGGDWLVVCQYSPAGNWRNRFPSQVLPPVGGSDGGRSADADGPSDRSRSHSLLSERKPSVSVEVPDPGEKVKDAFERRAAQLEKKPDEKLQQPSVEADTASTPWNKGGRQPQLQNAQAPSPRPASRPPPRVAPAPPSPPRQPAPASAPVPHTPRDAASPGGSRGAQAKSLPPPQPSTSLEVNNVSRLASVQIAIEAPSPMRSKASLPGDRREAQREDEGDDEEEDDEEGGGPEQEEEEDEEEPVQPPPRQPSRTPAHRSPAAARRPTTAAPEGRATRPTRPPPAPAVPRSARPPPRQPPPRSHSLPASRRDRRPSAEEGGAPHPRSPRRESPALRPAPQPAGRASPQRSSSVDPTRGSRPASPSRPPVSKRRQPSPGASRRPAPFAPGPDEGYAFRRPAGGPPAPAWGDAAPEGRPGDRRASRGSARRGRASLGSDDVIPTWLQAGPSNGYLAAAGHPAQPWDSLSSSETHNALDGPSPADPYLLALTDPRQLERGAWSLEEGLRQLDLLVPPRRPPTAGVAGKPSVYELLGWVGSAGGGSDDAGLERSLMSTAALRGSMLPTTYFRLERSIEEELHRRIFDRLSQLTHGSEAVTMY